MSGTPRDLFPDLYPNAKPAPKPKKTSETSSINSQTKPDPMKTLWCETQWSTLSQQAKTLGLATEPYFDPETMLLSKEVNVKLWKELGKLYSLLGPDKAAHATPVMLEGGEVEWHSYVSTDKGQKAEFYENHVDAWWA